MNMRNTIIIGDSAMVMDTEQNHKDHFGDYIGREGVVVSKVEYPNNSFVRISWGFLDYIDVAVWRIKKVKSKDLEG